MLVSGSGHNGAAQLGEGYVASGTSVGTLGTEGARGPLCDITNIGVLKALNLVFEPQRRLHKEGHMHLRISTLH